MSNVCAIFGSIVHSISFGNVEIIENGAVIYEENTGTIIEVFRGSFDDFIKSTLIKKENITGMSIIQIYSNYNVVLLK